MMTTNNKKREKKITKASASVCLLRPWQARTHCCRHKCFLVCPHAQHLLQTQISCRDNKCFWFCSETFRVRKKCFPVWATTCPQQCVLVYQGLTAPFRKELVRASASIKCQPWKRASMFSEIYIHSACILPCFAVQELSTFKHESQRASGGRTFPSTYLVFANNSSKDQILRAFLNWMGPFDTPCMVNGAFDVSVNFVPLLKFTHLYRSSFKVVVYHFCFQKVKMIPRRRKARCEIDSGRGVAYTRIINYIIDQSWPKLQIPTYWYTEFPCCLFSFRGI